jgi:short-subunit dehydrogenase
VEVEQRIGPHAGSIKFHHLDLATIESSRKSAIAFKNDVKRLDILVANAGISIIYQDELSADGYEKSYAAPVGSPH